MNFELLTFPCREMIKLSIHILYRKQIFRCFACIVYIDSKTSNAFSPLCIFELKVVFRYHFLSHFLAELNESGCGSLLNNTVFDVITELFAYVIMGQKKPQLPNPPWTLNDVPR